MKKIALLIALMISVTINANYVGSSESTISYLSSYNAYGDGDVIFKIANAIPACSDGYWLTKADPGFAANLSMLLASYQAKNTVVVYGLPDLMWGGSSGLYCKLYSIRLI